MADLIAKTPLDDRAPFEVGDTWISEVEPGRLTWVAPFRGRRAGAARILEAELGLGFPAPGRVLEHDGARCIWSGRAQAFLVAAEPPAALAGEAALADLSDGWAVLRLAGPSAEAVLARLVPVDLREPGFGPAQVACSELAHIPALILRAGDGFEVMVMRSFAESAWRELTEAMRGVAARPRR